MILNAKVRRCLKTKRRKGMSAETAFNGLYGNTRLKSYLLFSVAENKLPHALIIEGAAGSGKKTAALLTLSAMEPDFSKKIMTFATPDVTLHTLAEGKKTIGVSEVRDIRYQAYVKPQELSFRAFIIDRAETMTPEAQNALLKIFEEPPANVFFFLLCDNASALLPTVRSRAPMLKTERFDTETLSEYLISHNENAKALYLKDKEAFRLLVRASDGAIGEAVRRLGDNDSSVYEIKKRTEKLISLLSGGKSSEVLCFFSSLKPSREELRMMMLELCGAVRDMLAAKYGISTEPVFFSSRESAEEGSASFARLTLMALYDESARLADILGDVNVNAQLFAVRCADALADALK